MHNCRQLSTKRLSNRHMSTCKNGARNCASSCATNCATRCGSCSFPCTMSYLLCMNVNDLLLFCRDWVLQQFRSGGPFCLAPGFLVSLPKGVLRVLQKFGMTHTYPSTKTTVKIC